MKEELLLQSFSYEEVLNECLSYFEGDELAATTWMHKYAIKDNKGNYLEKTPADMHRRMAVEFARMEQKYEVKPEEYKGLSDYGTKRSSMNEQSIFELFKDFKYVIPQGSVMSSLGNKSVI